MAASLIAVMGRLVLAGRQAGPPGSSRSRRKPALIAPYAGAGARALVEANGALLYDNELANWHLVSILMSDETAKTVALGWHDDKRMEADYKLVDEYLKMEKPYDIKTAYTNEFLDKALKMPPINPPKLY